MFRPDLYYVQMTWDEAYQTCQSSGTDLVSIHSSEENTFVFNLAGNKTTWTGGSDRDTEGSFTWTDGTPWDTNLWSSGNPDQFLVNQDCVTMSKLKEGLFNDVRCTERFQFVCKGGIAEDE